MRSQSETAGLIGVSQKTVSNWVKDTSNSTSIPLPETRTDSIGRTRKTTHAKPRRTIIPTEAETVQVELSPQQREIAGLLGIGQKTVSRWLKDVSHVTYVDLPETITDSKGRDQPASKVRRTIVPTEAETVQVELSPQQREIAGLLGIGQKTLPILVTSFALYPHRQQGARPAYK